MESKADEAVVNEQNKVVTTAAYMLASGIVEVALGVDKLVKQLLALS